MRLLPLCLTAPVALCVSLAWAAPPLIYEGRLLDAAGNPPAAWPALRFALEDEAGAALWSTTIDADDEGLQADPQGRFNAQLADGWHADGRMGPVDDVDFALPRWLAVEVCTDGAAAADCANWQRLDPRQRIGAVPYATQAGRDSQYQLEDLVVSTAPGPGEFGSIHEALAALDRKLLPPDRDITIHIRPGLYVHDRPIEVWRTDGNRLRIVGDDQETVLLHFNRSSALVVHAGAHLGGFDGMQIVGDQLRGGGRGEYKGVYVEYGAFARLGPDLLVAEFSHTCVHARFGAVLDAQGVHVADCNVYGFVSNYGSFVNADGAEAVRSGYIAFAATLGGTMLARNTRVGGGISYVAQHMGYITASDAVVVEGQDAEADFFSHIHADGASFPGGGADAWYISR